jgi:uncharacterized membrane protein YeaQ/YmgE (transglycosylase-associated protein family)
MNLHTVLGWLAIGIAASLAGMIFPFRRGTVGIAMNVMSGAAGALIAPLLSYFVIPAQQPDTPLRLAFAAFGAFAGLGVAHFGYSRFTRRRPTASQGDDPVPPSVGSPRQRPK